MNTICKSLGTIFILVLMYSFAEVKAQKIGVKEKAKNAAENKANGKVDETINKGLDKLEKGIGGIFKKKDKSAEEEKEVKSTSKSNKANDEEETNAKQIEPSFASYNKFDFVPGDKILAFDDFKQDAMGDLPAKWNSTGGAEIAKVNSSDFNWVQLTGSKAFFSPQYTSKMPDNCTVDFDMILTYNQESNWYQRFLIELISSATLVGASQDAYMSSNTGVSFEMEPRSKEIKAMSYLKGETVTEAKALYTKLNSRKPIHVSIMRQQQRVKIYFDEKKVYDLPQALAVSPNYYVRFGTFVQDEGDAETTKMYISNLRYAVGKPDMRNKLLTEGKLVTRGILFDSGSAIIKPQSAGVLKEIAAVLNENVQLKVKIIGHTDSDGDNAKNLELSEQRAMAIKTALVNEFNVNEDHLTAAGLGETKPVDVNTTAAGKANNRRVEFIKQ
ncbi:MAG TPA: OmpA family protein [Pedobacter sp.]|nr:OmpA family protein [Pedobacter sp.]